MLRHVPAELPELESPQDAWIQYADIATKIAAAGVSLPDAGDEDAVARWREAVRWLALPSSVGPYWLSPTIDWRGIFGFDAFHVDGTLSIEAPPFGLTVIEGRFDTAELSAACERSGYEQRESSGSLFFSLGDELDLTAPASRFPLGRMNHAAMLSDGALVFTRWEATMQSVLALDRGEGASLAERVDLAALLPALWPDLVTATIVPGAQLIGEAVEITSLLGTPMPDVDALATETANTMAELRRMPPVLVALLGLTAGGAPSSDPGTAVAQLVMSSAEAAQHAADVIEDRLVAGATREGQSYADLFAAHRVRTLSDTTTVLVELDLAAETPGDILVRLLTIRDLDLFVWSV
jgi:hypothetical protein